MTRVVHLNEEEYDVLIDRTTIWGNPYSHKDGTLALYKTATRKESIGKYLDYVLSNEELLARLPELQGKTLGCWCHPRACHGDVLADLSNRKGIL